MFAIVIIAPATVTIAFVTVITLVLAIVPAVLATATIVHVTVIGVVLATVFIKGIILK